MADQPQTEVVEPDTDAGDATAHATEGPGDGAGPRAVKPGRWPRRRLLWLIGGILAVVALAISAAIAWQAINQDNTVLTQVAGTKIARDPQDPGQVIYTDPGTRFRLSFPASWSTRQAGGADVRLLAGPGDGNLISVRVVTLDTGSPAPPTPASLKPYLDTIVQEPTVKIVQQDQIVLDHLGGWYYVYTFQDSSTRAEGIHAQYFIIRGNQLYSIVFQALPASDFTTLAPTYQRVANSIQFY